MLAVITSIQKDTTSQGKRCPGGLLIGDEGAEARVFIAVHFPLDWLQESEMIQSIVPDR